MSIGHQFCLEFKVFTETMERLAGSQTLNLPTRSSHKLSMSYLTDVMTLYRLIVVGCNFKFVDFLTIAGSCQNIPLQAWSPTSIVDL